MCAPRWLATVLSSVSPAEEMSCFSALSQAFDQRRIVASLRQGCILASISDARSYTPEQIIRIMVDAMKGVSTQVVLQIGTERLLTWQPGAKPLHVRGFMHFDVVLHFAHG